MSTNDEQYRNLKNLYECGVITKDAYEAGKEKLGYKITNSQAGIIGDHGTIIGDVHIHPPDKTKSHPDEIVKTYCSQLITSLQHLPLRGIDTQSSDPSGEQKHLELDRIYVELDTTERVIEIRGEKKADADKDLLEDSKAVTALEAVTDNRFLVILGAPGSGKSTFINHLIVCLCRDKSDHTTCDLDIAWPKELTDFFPIPVIMRDFAQWLSSIPEKAEASHLWEFIESQLASRMLDNVSGLIKDALDKGKAIVLLDGLDEIPTMEKRRFIRDAVNAFAVRYNKSRYIVTCRVLSYQNKEWQLDENIFDTVELAPFDEPKIDLFIIAWYQDLMRLHVIKTPEECDELIHRLKTAVRRRDLWHMAPNPLLLTVMAMVHTHKGRLPDARALLYEESLEILLWRWEQVKTTSRASLPRLRELLQEVNRADADLKKVLWQLAFETHGKSEQVEKDHATADISEWDLTKAFSKLHPDHSLDWARKVINTIKMRAGLLIEGRPGIFAFPHRTFQEYLAGAHLSIQKDFVKVVCNLIESSHFWREAVLLAVGRLVYLNVDYDKPLTLAAELCPLESPDSDTAWRKIWLAGDVLHEVGMNRVKDSNFGRELLERISGRLLELVTRGKLSPKERVAAGNTLSYLGDPRFDPENWHLPKGEDMGFISMSSGSFVMGSDKDKDPDTRDNEKPHKVELSSYAMAKYPVTVAAFEAFIQDSGYQPKGDWKAYNEFSNHPVVNVSWHDALKYCEWLTEKLKEYSVQVRLPTEAQWEYAASGTDGRIYPCGNELAADQANYNFLIGGTSPVGVFPEDRCFFGCLDMTGNVCEWCHDWYDENYYADSPRLDPTGPNDGSLRGLRGGSWVNIAWDCRSAYRFRSAPVVGGSFIGFRLALHPSQQ